MEGALEHNGVVARMLASNLSGGGVYCTSNVDFPEMTRLGVRMMLPASGGVETGTAPLDVEAVVVRRKSLGSSTGNGERYELALFFTRIDDIQKTRLNSFIEQSA
jgi:hypothetical protein